MKKDDCLSPMCICHVGKSRIFSFDFEKEELKLEHELNEGSYLISIDGNGVCYYYDSYIYQNGNKVCEVNKVEPYGEFMLYESVYPLEKNVASVEGALFCKYDDFYYSYYINNLNNLNDKIIYNHL